MHLFPGRCKVPKDAPHAVLKSPHPYNNTAVKSDSKLNRPVTSAAAITPHPTSQKHERACTSEDPPMGNSPSNGSKHKGCEVPSNVSAVTPTKIPTVSETRDATPTLPHTSKLLPSDNSEEQKEDSGKSPLPNQRTYIPPQAITTAHYSQTSVTRTPVPGQSSTWATSVATKSYETVTAHSPCCEVSETLQSATFKSRCRSCLNENMTKRTTTAKPSRTALQILSRTTEPPRIHTAVLATTEGPALIKHMTLTSTYKTDSRLQLAHTSLKQPPTKASSRLTRKGLRRHIALRNLTGECKQLLILSLLECQLPTR